MTVEQSTMVFVLWPVGLKSHCVTGCIKYFKTGVPPTYTVRSSQSNYRPMEEQTGERNCAITFLVSSYSNYSHVIYVFICSQSTKFAF